MLYNIKELKWDDEILEILNIPKAMLPESVLKPACRLSPCWSATR